MPVGRVTGYPDYTFDSTNKYIPILFAGKTLEKFYAKTIATQISNTDYVGQVKNVGDRVIIRTIPNITIRDYQRGATLLLEYPESPAIEFSVNRAKYYNFALDDIDIKQMDIDWLNKFSDDAAMQLKIVYDTEFLGTIYTQVDTYNQGTNAGKISQNLNLGTTGSPITLGDGSSGTVTPIDAILRCWQVLDEQNVPEDSRFMVVPPAVMSKFLNSDLRMAHIMGDNTSAIRTMNIGSVANFDIYTSNLLSKDATTGGWHCVFGHKKACVYVMQLTKNEMYRPQTTFANAMKGLVVYDFKVLYPQLLGHLFVK
jgi:hypothetical protein